MHGWRLRSANDAGSYNGMQSIEHCTGCCTKLYAVKACCTELLPKFFKNVSFAYIRSLEGSQKAAEVLCDVTPDLVAYQPAVETLTHSYGMRTHTGQHSRLPSMHTLTFAFLLYVASRNHTKTNNVTPNLCCTKTTLNHLLEGFSLPNLSNILGNNFSIGTLIAGRLISKRKKIGESLSFKKKGKK